MKVTCTAKARITMIGICAVAAFGLCIAGPANASTRPYERATANETQSAWSADLDCAECHPAQAETILIAETAPDNATNEEARDRNTVSSPDAHSVTVPNSLADIPSTYAAMHTQTLGITCITCHEDSEDLAEAHSGMDSGKEATRLKKTDVPSELCIVCHDETELVKATVDSIVLVDDNGTTVNPHELPKVTDHEGVACVDCHQAHETEKTLAQTSMITCSNCHHAGVFECGACH